MKKAVVKFFGLLASFVLVFAMSNSVLAQGKSGNKGKGKSNVNRGKSADKKNSDRTDRDDRDRRNRSDRDDRDDRNRQNRTDDDDDDYNYRGNKDRWKNNQNRDNRGDRLQGQSNRFRGLSRKIGMSPEDAQDWYEREKDLNPNLTYGQFVAANMIARNNNSRNPRLTTEAVLDRLRDGQNFGQAVKGLGLSGSRYEDERRRIRREIEDNNYNDRDRNDRYNYRIGW
jgi:hypothetical protein